MTILATDKFSRLQKKAPLVVETVTPVVAETFPLAADKALPSSRNSSLSKKKQLPQQRNSPHLSQLQKKRKKLGTYTVETASVHSFQLVPQQVRTISSFI